MTAVHARIAHVPLFRLHAERMDENVVDDSNRDAYREPEAAGLVVLSRPCTGPRTDMRTKLGWKLEDVLARMGAILPSP